MNKTIRKFKGTKVDPTGSVISVLMETMDGTEVIIEIIPEAVNLLAAELVNARTLADINAEGAVPVVHTAAGNVMRQPIAALKVVAAEHPDSEFVLVQVLTEGGGLFEFLVPATELFRQTPAGKQ